MIIFKWTLLVALPIMLAALLMYSWYRNGQLEQRFPPTGRFIDVDGIRLHYLDSLDQVSNNPTPTDPDQRPVIVLLHGASTSAQDFSVSLLPQLSHEFRVIAFDRPGHGYSERGASGAWPSPKEQARLINQALQQLGVEQALWLGHSWSGSVVLAALLEYPQQVQAGVLLAGASHPWRGGVAWYNSVASQPVLGKMFAWLLALPIGELSLGAAVKSVFAPSEVSPDYIESTAVPLSLRPNTFVNNAIDISNLNTFLKVQSEKYTDIEQPLLLISGRNDVIVPAWNHAQRLSKQVGQAKLQYLEDAGHALHHSHTGQVVQGIRSFIAAHEDKMLGRVEPVVKRLAGDTG